MPTPSRSRRSAKTAGTRFERLIVDYLALHVDDRIERRTRNGTKDRGDVSGLRHMGARVVIECKDTSRLSLGAWLAEAEVERGNDDAVAAVVAHKRHGKGEAAEQLVTMRLVDFVALLTGNRPDHERPSQARPRVRCSTCGRFEDDCREVAVRTGDPHPFAAPSREGVKS